MRGWWVIAGACLAAAVVPGGLTAPALQAARMEGQAERSLADGVYTDEQARRGRKEYTEKCATCHATTLRGGEMGPELVGQTFLGGWRGQTLWLLFDFTLATMPQDNPGGVSPEALNDILAFVLQRNDFPAGSAELSLDPAAEGDPIAIE
jgi:quinoprotein glucose dehydrogenase